MKTELVGTPKMRLPRFTAEASLYKPSEHYQKPSTGVTTASGTPAVVLALPRAGLQNTCGQCICDGPCRITSEGCECSV